jgi:glucosamine 6-phosphate synthetase-like amidotransferase/phosphosugar isomerase protein
MKFFTVTDDSGVKHKILVVPLSVTEMGELSAQCKECMPSISVSSMVQNGHPYVIVDFGSGGSYKTAIALDEESEDGDKVGDELGIGDLLTVILTSDSKAVKVSRDKVYMNMPLEQVIAFSFLFTADIAENYALFKMYKQPKGE